MASYAETAAKLLTDAGAFFRTLAEQNPPLKEQMTQNAAIFDQISALVLQDPLAMLDDKNYAVLSAQLLNDAATFFRTLAEQNEPIRKQMMENAFVYDKIAELVRKDPHGVMD